MCPDEPIAHPHPEVLQYYGSFEEENRLSTGPGRTRSGSLVSGTMCTCWTPTDRLVREARRLNGTAAKPVRSIELGDARHLPFADASVDAVLLMGPLYHLLERRDRMAAIREALRVLRSDGVLFAAGISRYAGVLDALVFHPGIGPALAEMRHRAMLTGRYYNTSGDPRYFVTAYFHRPEDLAGEVAEAGGADAQVFGIEGPGWLVSDFDRRWEDPAQREELMTAARRVESEPAIRGVSAHMLAVATRR